MTLVEYYANFQTFEKNRKVGLRDRKTGREIIPANNTTINTVCPFYADQIALIKVKQGGKYLFYNMYGVKVTDKMDYIGDYNQGIARFSKGGKWGFLNSSGAAFISPKYTCAERITRGKFMVQQNNKWGIVDRTGEVIKPEYDNIIVSSERIYGKKGNEVIRLLI